MANCTVKSNVTLGGIEIKFSAAPKPEVIADVKRRGFRWSSRNKVWYKKFTSSDYDWAMEYCGEAEVQIPEEFAGKEVAAYKYQWPYEEQNYYVPMQGPYNGPFSIAVEDRLDLSTANVGDRIIVNQHGYPYEGTIVSPGKQTMVTSALETSDGAFVLNKKSETVFYTPLVVYKGLGNQFRVSADQVTAYDESLLKEDYTVFVPGTSQTPYVLWNEILGRVRSIKGLKGKKVRVRIKAKADKYLKEIEVAESLLWRDKERWLQFESKHPGYALMITGESEDEATYRRYAWKRYKTAAEQKVMELLKRKIVANPYKWQIGDGVGVKIGTGSTGRYGSSQINRGFAIVGLDIDKKQAAVKQVADTGIAGAGVYVSAQQTDLNLGKVTMVDMGDLVRDRNYDLSDEAIKKYLPKTTDLMTKKMESKEAPGEIIIGRLPKYNFSEGHIFNGQYFIDQPGKVLGQIVTHNPNTGRELTDQFGKPRPEVRGTIQDVIDGIDVPKVKRFSHFVELTEGEKVVKEEKNIGRPGIEELNKYIDKMRSAYRIWIGNNLGNLKDPEWAVNAAKINARQEGSALSNFDPEAVGKVWNDLYSKLHVEAYVASSKPVPLDAKQFYAEVESRLEFDLAEVVGGRFKKKTKANKNSSSAKIEKVIQKTKDENQAKVDRSGNCSGDLRCLSDAIGKYNSEVEYKDKDGHTRYYTISEEEIKVWVTYQVNQRLYDREVISKNDWGKYYEEDPNWLSWFGEGLVGYDGSSFIPEALFYAGNIYSRLEELRRKKSEIIQVVGEDGYDLQLEKMEACKPPMLIITDDPSRKLHLSPFDKIWEDVDISALADGQEVPSSYSIGAIFYRYFLQQLPGEDLVFEKKRTTAYDIYNYWVEKNNFRRGTSDQEKASIKRNTTVIGSILFDRFLLEMLTSEDQTKIAGLWNSLRNNYKAVDYYKIPVGFESGSMFKGGALSVRPAQREGIAFMNARGTGIVAYDVGVGKTMTAILAISDGFGKGLFKRPLIVVPQKVYRKWIAEISGVFADKDIYEEKVDPDTRQKKRLHKAGDLISEGILPHIKVNDYDNLGVNFISRAKDENGVTVTVEEYSITIVTYEGLTKIGFGQETESGLVTRLKEALSQGESGRGQAIMEQKASGWIDEALKGTELDIEQMGIDAIIVDEGHNFRNLFMEVKGDVGSDGDRGKKNFLSGSSSTPSARAISLFMLNAYVQDKNNRRNTFGLTATPFTNRATEIYSMLALYDYLGLRDFDVYNIAQFCTAFIDETLEDVWTAAGKFEARAVIRGYNNLPILQSMIFRSIIYKTGEDANIQRPEKVVLPLKTDEKGVPLPFEYMIDTTLQPTSEQMKWITEAAHFADNTDIRRRDSTILAGYYPPQYKGIIPGQVLVSLNVSRVVTFSPYALFLNGEAYYDLKSIDAEKFVENSPKIRYVVECMRTVKKYHEQQGTPVSGQILYSDRGTEFFPLIAEYLVDNLGYNDKEVAVFHGGVSKGKRESIKEGFLDGSIKVIIGSSTMREGVDLQKYGTVLYMCYLDWNPTDIQQLIGRIWRFGNKFSHVRIVAPLVENSSDVFTWQKLSEKMSRLNSIWSRADGTKVFEDSELNPEELKKSLINDPEEIARYEIAEKVEERKSELVIAEGALTQLKEAGQLKSGFVDLVADIDRFVKDAQNQPKFQYGTVDRELKAQELRDFEVTDIKSKLRLLKQYARVSYDSYTINSVVERFIKYKKKIDRLETTVLARYKLTIFDEFSNVVEDYVGQVERLTAEIALIQSAEYFEDVLFRVQAEKEETQANSRTVEQRVAEFQRLNYLLDCRKGVHSCDIYGRVEDIKSGQVIEVVPQEKPVIVDLAPAAYQMQPKLAAFMPREQQKTVKEILKGEEGEGYVQSVLKPLEEQIAGIPGIRDTEKIKLRDKIVQAHFFIGSSDWYIVEWDGKDEMFGYAILNGDLQNAEWGYIPLPEIRKIKMMQLDFFWTPKPFREVLKEDDEVEIEATASESSLDEAIEALKIALEFADGNDRAELKEAIEALEIALEFA